jgi:hypothetical protein
VGNKTFIFSILWQKKKKNEKEKLVIMLSFLGRKGKSFDNIHYLPATW